MRTRPDLESLLDREIRRLAPRVLRITDALAARPEVSGEERFASSLHIRFLTARGFEVRRGASGLSTAYQARQGWGGEGSVAFAAEMDALPELGHGCGHNLGGGVSLLAGAALATLLPQVGGSVTVWGTPQEERGGGKALLARGGAFDDHDLLGAIHPGSTVSYLRPRFLAFGGFEASFRPRQGEGKAWRLFLHGADLLRRSLPPEVRLLVRPDGADSLRGHLWAPDRALLKLTLDRLRECAAGCGEALGEEADFLQPDLPMEELRPSPSGEALTEEVFRDLGVPASSEPTILGLSDLGNASRRCPVIQPVLAMLDRPCGWHTREFASQTTSSRAHGGVLLGARILARVGLRVLLDPDLRRTLREEVPRGSRGTLSGDQSPS